MEIRINRSLLLLLLLYQCVCALDSNNCSTIGVQDLTTYPKKNPEMRFYLFTKDNYYYEQEIINGNLESLRTSNFNDKWPVRIIVHGWKNSLLNCFNAVIKDAYLKKGNFNVIVVDWSDWANSLNYFYVVSLVFDIIGEKLANFTKFLNIDGNISYDNIYLIGHSLGAQMAGAAGQYIKPNQYNTIFALDAAGPLFEYRNNNKKIDTTDAKYVESITTNAGTFGCGYNGIIGHASFYPNYGKMQKYCLLHEPNRYFCNHMLVYKYFAESINSPTGFCAERCDYNTGILHNKCSKINSCSPKILMGGEPSVPKIGTYYVNTKFRAPFALCICKI